MLVERMTTSGGPNQQWLIGGFLIVATLAVYWQVRNHDFVNYDDQLYVMDQLSQPRALTTQNIVWAFTTTHTGNWYPVSWLSHLLDCRLFGLNAGPHHLVNVFLHLANTLLLFAVLTRMTGATWRSGLVAALFALHPLHVESVAWVAERKDVLSMLFWLLTMWSYVRYVERPRPSRYWLTLALFALGLTAKPMLVTLPVVLLLLDVWPLRRSATRKLLVVEKLPFFALAMAAGIVAVWAQRTVGAVMPMDNHPLGIRVANALVAYVRYIGKMIRPTGLAVFYPFVAPWSLTQIAGAAVLLAALTGLVLWCAKRQPFLSVGWFWYVVTLLPVIGLVQVGSQSIADRYTYIPLIGLFIMIVWGIGDLVLQGSCPKPVVFSLTAIVLLACAASSWLQLRHWRNSVTLFRHALEVTEGNYLAHNNLGTALIREGKTDEALEHFTESVRLKPTYAETQVNLGTLLTIQVRAREALPHLEYAVRLKPSSPDAHNDLGFALSKEGKFAEAIGCYERALQLRPAYPEAHHNLGVALGSLGKHAEAVPHFAEAVRLKPDYAEAYFNFGVALHEQGKIKEAARQFEIAHRLDPKFPVPADDKRESR